MECVKVLKHAMSNVEGLARFMAVYIYSVVLDNEKLLSNKELAETIRPENLQFDPEKMREECSRLDGARDAKLTKTAPNFIARFRKAETSQQDEPAPPEVQPATVSFATAKFATRR